ncbi:MAG: hypothetical protein ACTSVI_17060 [Promethearchaeota archaeon]
MRDTKRKISFKRKRLDPSIVEVTNVLGWSAFLNILIGLLSFALWYAFTKLDIVQEYLNFAKPLITDAVISLFLPFALISIISFTMDIISIILVVQKKKAAKYLVFTAGILELWIIPVGTFFGVILLSLGKKIPDVLSTNEEIFPKKMIDSLLIYNLLFSGMILCYLLLILPAAYIIPLEFVNDEDLMWLRMNFWNIFYLINGIFAAIVAFFGITTIFTIKRYKSWRTLLFISCFLMLFAIPIGSYLSGVFYRNALKKNKQKG